MPLKRSPVAHKTRSHGITSHVTHNDDYNMVEECAALQEGQRSGGNSTPEDSPQQDATPLDNFMDEPIPSRADMWKQLTDMKRQQASILSAINHLTSVLQPANQAVPVFVGPSHECTSDNMDEQSDAVIAPQATSSKPNCRKKSGLGGTSMRHVDPDISSIHSGATVLAQSSSIIHHKASQDTKFHHTLPLETSQLGTSGMQDPSIQTVTDAIKAQGNGDYKIYSKALTELKAQGKITHLSSPADVTSYEHRLLNLSTWDIMSDPHRALLAFNGITEINLRRRLADALVTVTMTDESITVDTIFRAIWSSLCVCDAETILRAYREEIGGTVRYDTQDVLQVLYKARSYLSVFDTILTSRQRWKILLEYFDDAKMRHATSIEDAIHKIQDRQNLTSTVLQVRDVLLGKKEPTRGSPRRPINFQRDDRRRDHSPNRPTYYDRDIKQDKKRERDNKEPYPNNEKRFKGKFRVLTNDCIWRAPSFMGYFRAATSPFHTGHIAIDCGADASLVSYAWLKNHNLTSFITYTREVWGAFGAPATTLGTISMTLTLDGKEFHTFLCRVMTQTSLGGVHLLLGSDFFYSMDSTLTKDTFQIGTVKVSVTPYQSYLSRQTSVTDYIPHTVFMGKKRRGCEPFLVRAATRLLEFNKNLCEQKVSKEVKSIRRPSKEVHSPAKSKVATGKQVTNYHKGNTKNINQDKRRNEDKLQQVPSQAEAYKQLWSTYQHGTLRLMPSICDDFLKGLQKYQAKPLDSHRQQLIHASPCITYLCLQHERRELLRQRLLHHCFMRLHKCRLCGFDPSRWLRYMDMLAPIQYYAIWKQDACYDILTGEFWPIDEASNIHDCYHLIDSQTPMDVKEYKKYACEDKGSIGVLHRNTNSERQQFILSNKQKAKDLLTMFPEMGDSVNDAHPDFIPSSDEDTYYLPPPNPTPVNINDICSKIQVDKKHLSSLTNKYKDILQYRGAGSSDIPPHVITLKQDAKFSKKQHNFPIDSITKQFYKEQCDMLVQKGIAEWVKDMPRNLPFTVDNLPHIKAVEKKDHTWRAIIPAIELNSNTVKDLPNLPNINTILANIGPFACCSVLDLHSGFFVVVHLLVYLEDIQVSGLRQ